MAPSYEIDPEAGLVTFIYRLDPTFEEWRSTMETVFAHPGYRPGFHFLGDRRSVQTPPDRMYIGRIVEWMNIHADKVRGARWATLVSTPASYGMGRMGQVLGEGGPVALGVFLDHAEAMRWLRGEAESRSG